MLFIISKITKFHKNNNLSVNSQVVLTLSSIIPHPSGQERTLTILKIKENVKNCIKNQRVKFLYPSKIKL